MKPYYSEDGITIYHGDCRLILPALGWIQADVAFADPPYGDTSLEWDRWQEGWVDSIRGNLKSNASLWCFGSFRMFWRYGHEFSGWRYAQDIVWQKHNGSSFHADRFKRVHELAVQFYRGEWADVFKAPVTTNDATKRTVRRKARPPHTGHIEAGTYVSQDGGPRLMRSVIDVRSCHGYAVHPTQKPEGIVRPLVQYSLPPGGLALVPFVGSGTELSVVREMGGRAIGFEANEAYCEIAANRLRQGVLFGMGGAA